MNWGTIGLVWLVGAGLLLTELLVPGMIVGALGVICLLAAVVMAFQISGPVAGLGMAVGSVGLLAAVVKVGVRSAGHRHELTKEGGFTGTDDHSALVGHAGEAATDLRPGGYATIDGRRVDVVTAGEHLAVGTPVEVVKVEGNRIQVAARTPAKG